MTRAGQQGGAKASDLHRAFAEDGAKKTHVGGQALLEGVMMRGKYNWAVAVRSPNGSIYLEEHDLASGRPKNSWMNKPLVRGCRAMVESLGLGFKALEVATSRAFDEFDMTWKAYQDAGVDPAAATRLERARAAQVDLKDYPELQAEAAALAAGAAGESAGSAGDQAAAMSAVAAVTATAGETADAGSSAPAAATPVAAAAVAGEGSATPLSPESQDAKPQAPAAQTQSAQPEEQQAGGLGKAAMTVSMLGGVVLAVVLFMAAPLLLTNLLVGQIDSSPMVWGVPLLWNVVNGALRVIIFVAYMWLIGRMEDIKRMYGYHGAEHKTIHCHEHGLELTPENARRFPCLHVRCGTAFLIMVLIIAILVYTVIPISPLLVGLGVTNALAKSLVVLGVHLLFLPVIAGVSYEITVRWAGSNPENPLVKVILWPGMQMQRLTTREPDSDQLECAIAAMKLVLEREEREAAKTAAHG